MKLKLNFYKEYSSPSSGNYMNFLEIMDQHLKEPIGNLFNNLINNLFIYLFNFVDEELNLVQSNFENIIFQT